LSSSLLQEVATEAVIEIAEIANNAFPDFLKKCLLFMIKTYILKVVKKQLIAKFIILNEKI
jgi:hypothetical protein